jgi:hypothetical protein
VRAEHRHASLDAADAVAGGEGCLHLEDGELDLVVGQGAPDHAAGHDLDDSGRRVDQHQDAVRGRDEGGVQALGVRAGLAVGVTHEHRELEAAVLLGRADRPVDLELVGRGEVTSCH